MFFCGATVCDVLIIQILLQNPVWNQQYSFELGENCNYVNVCVWVKLSEEKGNLLIGHVCSVFYTTFVLFLVVVHVGNLITH